jgi:hypothetical protein
MGIIIDMGEADRKNDVIEIMLTATVTDDDCELNVFKIR